MTSLPFVDLWTEMWGVRAGLGLALGATVGAFAATAALRLAASRQAALQQGLLHQDLWPQAISPNPSTGMTLTPPTSEKVSRDTKSADLQAFGLQSLRGRSRCDGCGRTLNFSETVPILSFLALGGSCRSCGAEIDRLHFVSEIIGALALSTCLVMMPGLDGLLTGLLSLCLLISVLIDIKTLTLPDGVTAVIGIIAFSLAILNGHLLVNLLGAVLAFAVLYVLKLVLERKHNRAMLGLGDIKLTSALALWLGVKTPVMLLVAAILGLVFIGVSKRKDLIPFGPMIGIASFVVGVFIPEGWLV